MKEGKILIVDDDKDILTVTKMFLQLEFNIVNTLSDPNQLYNFLSKDDYDVILLDMNFSAERKIGNEGFFWLKEIKKIRSNTQVIMITAYGDIELTVKALKNGAADFIVKPWENEKLLATVQSAYRYSRSNFELQEIKKREKLLKKEFSSTPELIFASKQMEQVMQMVSKVAETDANVLITGENGTGKELIAREIHRQSKRSDEIFLEVDMGAVPETLFESELFGHMKGSFTDAISDRPGKFQLAHKGTLFLDEIGNLSLPMQSKLLSAIETRRVTPVGSNDAIHFDIRLISATNCKIEEMVILKSFREDLLYRLNTIHINLPPLRDRVDDIRVLAWHFLKKFSIKYKKANLKLSSQAVRRLMKYHWPGNVRELQHTIEKAVILADSDVLVPNDFMFKSKELKSDELPTIENMEKKLIESALIHYSGNYTAAAKQLGIARQSLYNKIKKYGL